jgi:hypothetical protein
MAGLDDVLAATFKDMRESLVADLNRTGHLFRNWTPQLPRFGPRRPQWDFGDLIVEWVSADVRKFRTPGYESDPAYLDRGDARELRDMLDRWIGDD